jgi:hypothetical protein
MHNSIEDLAMPVSRNISLQDFSETADYFDIHSITQLMKVK